MPILGVQNSTNQLYQRQYKEVVDEDNRINKRVINKNKERVQYMDMPISPQETQTTEANKIAFQQASENFLKGLEKLNNATLMEKTTGKKLTTDKLIPLFSMQELIISYNQMMRIMKDPTMPRSAKSLFENSLNAEIMPPLRQASQNYYQLATAFVADYLAPREEGARGPPPSRKYLVPQIISSYSLLETMQNNINRGVYDPVDYQMVQNQFTKIIQKDFPSIARIEEIKNLLKKDEKAFQDDKIKILEEELGRKLSTDERQRYINSLGSKVQFEPVFGQQTQRALEQVQSNIATALTPVVNTPYNLGAEDQENIIKGQIKDLEDLIKENEGALEETKKKLDDLHNEFRESDNEQEKHDIVMESQEYLRDYERMEKENKQYKKQLKQLQTAKQQYANYLNRQITPIYSGLENTAETAFTAPPINAQQVGQGRSGGTYFHRKANPFLSYEEFGNEAYTR